jgi:hypothetical protein
LAAAFNFLAGLAGLAVWAALAGLAVWAALAGLAVWAALPRALPILPFCFSILRCSATLGVAEASASLLSFLFVFAALVSDWNFFFL